MLNEPASASNDRSLFRMQMEEERQKNAEHDQRFGEIRELVREVFEIESEQVAPNARSSRASVLLATPDAELLIVFNGKLRIEADAAYDRLDKVLAAKHMFPVFREHDGQHVIYIVDGRAEPQPRPWWPNLVLLIATLFTVMLVGMQMAIAEVAQAGGQQAAQMIAANGLSELWRGLPYAISILLILGAHELGHYFAGRRHNLAVTLPYFIPSPFGFFGTFGAVIQLRQPMRNRRVLLDVGAAGPLAGLFFAIPILLIGLATSQTGPITIGGVVEGNSVLYAAAKFITFGEFLPNGVRDVYVNQLAWAGWTGLFVTGLNLIPLGQLDGGHVVYSLIGETARRLYIPALIALTIVTILSNGALLLILILLVLLGRTYAVPLDNLTPLDPRRRKVAMGTIVIFLLVFVPVPLTITLPPTGELPSRESAMLAAFALVLLPQMVGRISGWLRRR